MGREERLPARAWAMAAIGILLVALFHTSASLYLFDHGPLPAPSRFIVLSSVLGFGCLMVDPIAKSRFANAPMVGWMVFYAAATAIGYLLAGGTSQATACLLDRIYSILALGACLAVFVVPGMRRVVQWAVAASVVWGTAVNIYEAFHPLTFSIVIGRSAGLYVNPNISAIALLIGMLVSISILPEKARGAFLGVAGLGIFLTLSRAAEVLFMIAVAGLLWSRILSWRQAVAAFGLLFALIAVAGVAVVSGWWDPIQSGVLNTNTFDRILLMSSDASASQRAEVAQKAWLWVQQSPLLGHGLGTTSVWDADVAPHNIYLILMVDQGVFAMAIYLGLVWVTVPRTREGWVLAVVLILLGFFSHNLLEDRSFLLCLSLMAASRMPQAEAADAERQPA